MATTKEGIRIEKFLKLLKSERFNMFHGTPQEKWYYDFIGLVVSKTTNESLPTGSTDHENHNKLKDQYHDKEGDHINGSSEECHDEEVSRICGFFDKCNKRLEDEALDDWIERLPILFARHKLEILDEYREEYEALQKEIEVAYPKIAERQNAAYDELEDIRKAKQELKIEQEQLNAAMALLRVREADAIRMEKETEAMRTPVDDKFERMENLFFGIYDLIHNSEDDGGDELANHDEYDEDAAVFTPASSVN